MSHEMISGVASSRFSDQLEGGPIYFSLACSHPCHLTNFHQIVVMATCNDDLLAIGPFMKEVGASYQMNWSGIPHATHRSSPTNRCFATFRNCELFKPRDWLTANIHTLLHTAPILHVPVSSVLFRPPRTFTAESEGDASFYFANSVILPCLHIINKMFDKVEIRIQCEKEKKVTFDELNVQPGANQVEETKVYVDFHFSARHNVPEGDDENEWETFLLFKAKKPGSIKPKEWDPAKTGGELEGNAFLIAQQGRRYLSAFEATEIIFGDGVQMSGIVIPDGLHLGNMRTDDIIHGAGVFIEGEENNFLETFLSVMLRQLYFRGYV
jgi:hypothetical protein